MNPFDPKPFPDVVDSLDHDAFYLIHGSTVEEDTECWRTAWWDNDDNLFFDASGNEVVEENLLVVLFVLPRIDTDEEAPS